MLDKMIIPVAVVSCLVGVCIGYKSFSEVIEKEVPVIITKTEYMFIETEKKIVTTSAKRVIKKIKKPNGTKIEVIAEENIKQNENTSVNVRANTDTTALPVLRDNYSIGFGLRDVRDSNSFYVIGGINIVGGTRGIVTGKQIGRAHV